jgi:hypothetical protein
MARRRFRRKRRCSLKIKESQVVFYCHGKTGLHLPIYLFVYLFLYLAANLPHYFYKGGEIFDC